MSLPVNDLAFLAFFRNTPLETQQKVIEEAAPKAEDPVVVVEEEPYLKETELIIRDVEPSDAAVERPRRSRRSN